MSHHTLQAGAPGLPLGPGMVLKLEAIDPDNDAEISGVTSSRWSIYGYDASPVSFDDLFSVSPLLVPTTEAV